MCRNTLQLFYTALVAVTHTRASNIMSSAKWELSNTSHLCTISVFTFQLARKNHLLAYKSHFACTYVQGLSLGNEKRDSFLEVYTHSLHNCYPIASTGKSSSLSTLNNLDCWRQICNLHTRQVFSKQVATRKNSLNMNIHVSPKLYPKSVCQTEFFKSM